MTLEEKYRKAAELREFYHNRTIIKPNFFTKHPNYFAPTDNVVLNWICQIWIGLSLLSDFAGIYHDITHGGALFLDIGKLLFYPFKLLFGLF